MLWMGDDSHGGHGREPHRAGRAGRKPGQRSGLDQTPKPPAVDSDLEPHQGGHQDPQAPDHKAGLLPQNLASSPPLPELLRDRQALRGNRNLSLVQLPN